VAKRRQVLRLEPRVAGHGRDSGRHSGSRLKLSIQRDNGRNAVACWL